LNNDEVITLRSENIERMFCRSFVDLYCLFSYSFISQAENGKNRTVIWCFDRSRVDALRRTPKKRVRRITLYNRSALNASLRPDFFSAKFGSRKASLRGWLGPLLLLAYKTIATYIFRAVYQIFRLTVPVFSCASNFNIFAILVLILRYLIYTSVF